MKNVKGLVSYGIIICLYFFTGCHKENKISTPIVPSLPIIATDSVTNILSNAATVYSKVMEYGSSSITVRGVCWKTSSNPTISDNKTSDGIGTGIFTSSITGLNSSTTYYIKAYSTSSVGTAYSSELSFTTGLPFVIISTQKWTLKNLDIATYRDGTPIPQVTNAAAWASLTTGAYCYYKNDSATYAATYGKLYNWYAVNDVRGLAPLGWHIPSDAEWTTLSTNLGGDAAAGGTMKEAGTTHWLNSNIGATNSSGFTGLPSGHCDINGQFDNIGYYGSCWSSTEYNVDVNKALFRYLSYGNSSFLKFNYAKTTGFSIRCLHN